MRRFKTTVNLLHPNISIQVQQLGIWQIIINRLVPAKAGKGLLRKYRHTGDEGQIGAVVGHGQMSFISTTMDGEASLSSTARVGTTKAGH